MKFALNRDRILATTKGHTIEFKKGELTHVPPECYDEAIAIGAVPESEIEDDANTGPRRPESELELRQQVFAAFDAMVLKNEREDFTAGGAPHPKALSARLGWRIDAKERDTLWAAYQQRDKD